MKNIEILGLQSQKMVYNELNKGTKGVPKKPRRATEMEYTEFAKTEFHPDGTASVKLIFADGSHKWKLFDSKRKAIEYIKSNGFIQVKRTR